MDLNKIHEFTHAGVIALYERLTNSIILTKRSNELRKHPGEVCFPGGVWEVGDQSLYATSLRELYEELGIEPLRVQYLAELSIEQTLLGSIIHPWLGVVETLEPLNINTYEVARVISVPISLVQDPKNYKDIFIERRGVKFKTCQFTAHEEFIWGATARIMRQLVNVTIEQ